MLICDLAETYHVLNYRELSPSLVATLVSGLRDDSRVLMKLTGQKASFERMLMARIVDDTSFLAWAQTKDGAKGRNRPKSVVEAIMGKQEDEYESISSDQFTEVWRSIVE